MKAFHIKKIGAARHFLFLSFVLMIYACHPVKPGEQNPVIRSKRDAKIAKVDTAATFAVYPRGVSVCCKGNPSRFRALAAQSH